MAPQVLMHNEFYGGTYSFQAAGGAGGVEITGETWLLNFGVSNLDIVSAGITVLCSCSAVFLVVTYVSLALRKYVK